MSKAIVLHSGGLDSSVLLWHMRELGYEVLSLSILYGQRHRRELEAAERIAEAGRFHHQFVDLSSLRPLLGGSSQTDSSIAVPEGHYAHETMRATVVANRNMMLLSVATAYGISQKADVVGYAAHAGDHDVYPDCRQEFVSALSLAIDLCDYNPPKLLSPFVLWTKTQIAIRGAELAVPMELTRSCYNDGDISCGRCSTDIERIEAFYLAGIRDSTQYVDSEYWKTVCGVSNA